MKVSRLSIKISGTVQGVGFRPFVYRLATDLGLKGWVNNSAQGVFIEAEGDQTHLAVFLQRLRDEKPRLADIHALEASYVAPVGYSAFEIRHSEADGEKTALVLPDVATCPDCLREIFDPADRRYRYPFTNCTHCGPRYSIIQALPYDRPNTTMRSFLLCEACRAEYENPLDRRFHAQPTACPHCGPQLELWDVAGNVLYTRHEALLAAAEALREGQIVALKGLGGFHLMVDGRNGAAVAQLRRRKHRPDKPFALMFPTLDQIKAAAHVSDLEARLLTSPQAPILLLRRHDGGEIAPEVAPQNAYLGIMLPYTPLHHLLMAELNFPIVATSGNLSDEPICTDENEALRRLAGIADLFLVHNRPIARAVDDSIVCVMGGREMIVRRARGYAPSPLELETDVGDVLAVGGHLKNTVAAGRGTQVFISQHLGDLETAESYAAFERTIEDFKMLYEWQPKAVICDLHPDYRSTTYAEKTGLPLLRVQHHYTHVLACMAEHDIAEPMLGIAWDGTGYGTDGTIWGGEFLQVENGRFERVAHLRTFGLVGGEQAVIEPRRSALGLLYEIFGEGAFDRLEAFTPQEYRILAVMLRKGVNTPRTSSVGRLFDGAAALLGLCHKASFEGQAAMRLEAEACSSQSDEMYDFIFERGILDWQPMILGLLNAAEPISLVAGKFHNTLVEMMVAVARHAGLSNVLLTGGCFQNRYLCERAIRRLTAEGFMPYWHQRIPPNDGGIAFGQVMAQGVQVKRLAAG